MANPRFDTVSFETFIFETLKPWIERASLARLKFGLLRRYDDLLDQAWSPSHFEQAQKMQDWARSHLSKPHPQLGRPGAVCPFVPNAIDKDALMMIFHREIDGRDPNAVRDALLSHAEAFQKRWPDNEKGHSMRSLLIVFPGVAPERGSIVDNVHTELKTFLMQRGLMLSQFHPDCDKPAIHNAENKDIYKAPFPCIVVRHMGIHDIAFLAHNAFAFAEYSRRFGAMYESGKITNDHGYVDRYKAAKARFSF